MSNALPRDGIITAYHSNLLNALEKCTELHPLHIEVHNESCWYRMRRKLGAKRHSAIIVKQTPNTLSAKFDAYIYDLRRREEDLKYIPMKVMVGSAATKWQAFKMCDSAMRERDKLTYVFEEDHLLDKKMASIPKDESILNTHFRIIIVSEVFNRMSPIQRLAMVYEHLTQTEVGMSVKPATAENKYTNPPSRMRLSSTFGTNVCALKLFSFLPPASRFLPTELQFQLLTPSQWRPLEYLPLPSERFGETHLSLRSVEIEPVAKNAQQRNRIKQLTTEKKMITETKRSTDNLFSSGSIADSLGLDPSVSGIRSKKLGGIYGHFFNDLSDDVRSRVLSLIQDQKLINTLPDSGITEFSPSINNSSEGSSVINKRVMKDKLIPSNVSKPKKSSNNKDPEDLSKHTKTTSDMRDDILASSRRIELAAIKLQRIRRINQFYRARRRYWFENYAALQLQRVVRGNFARKYVIFLRILKPLAAIRIQRFMRFIRTRRVLRTWRYLVIRITRYALPKIKLFIKNCYQQWIRKRTGSSIKIQKTVRGKLVRDRLTKVRNAKEVVAEAFQKSCVVLQRVYRGYAGRKYFLLKKEECLRQLVDIPAAVRMQRIVRGMLAKSVMRRLKYELKKLLYLQTCIRRFVSNCWKKQKLYAQKLITNAITIQRNYRRFYDLKVVKLLRHKRWYVETYIPAIIKVQCLARRVRAKRVVQDKLKSTRAANIIRRSYQYYKRRMIGKAWREAAKLERIESKVTKIQKIVRRFCARKQYLRTLLAHRGKLVFAAKLIMRAWKTYKINLKYAFLIEENRKVLEAEKLEKLLVIHKEILLDIKETQGDIAVAKKSRERYRDRYKELDVYLTQAALRLIRIKREMVELKVEDYEKGWAEALGQEYEFLMHQSNMAREEIRITRSKLLHLDAEIAELCFEQEESEIELLDVDTKIIENIEKNRLRNIINNEKRANQNMKQLMFREKTHWRIVTNRKKKMRDNRSSYTQMVEQVT